MTVGADPRQEIRIDSLRTIGGASYWSAGPVTVVELSIGAYEDLSSAEIPGFTERLLAALPGLIEHRCNLGRRGGFVERLHRGTYAAHIVEHVALELQYLIGHEVGFGRARGGGGAGQYIVAFEHRHPDVGRESGATAVRLVQDALAGDIPDAQSAIERLATLARAEPSVSRPERRVDIALLGGHAHEAQAAIDTLRPEGSLSVVSSTPGELFREGLPFAACRIGMILDAEPGDLPEGYEDEESLRRLWSVLAEAVVPGGWLVIPEEAGDLLAIARERGLRSATMFTIDPHLPGTAEIARRIAGHLLDREE